MNRTILSANIFFISILLPLSFGCNSGVKVKSHSAISPATALECELGMTDEENECLSSLKVGYPEDEYSLTRNIAISEITAAHNGQVSSCEIDRPLPEGLVLAENCSISGTPSKLQAKAVYKITPKFKAIVGEPTSLAFTVLDSVPKIEYGSTSYAYLIMQNVETKPNSSGGQITSCMVVPNLPSGLSLSETCTISGTPTTGVGAADYTITASNGIGDGDSVVLTLSVEYSVEDYQFQGEGTVAAPYVMKSVSQLVSLSEDVSGWDKEFKLETDLDFSTVPTPHPVIGDGDNNFSGVFDGQGHTISNWTRSTPADDYVGVFGHVRYGTVKNLSVVNISVQGNKYVGGIVGLGSSATFENLSVSGSVTATTERAGGLMGHASSARIDGCVSHAAVSGPAKVGGLVGRAYAASIHNSHATGLVTGQSNTGGLVGEFTYEGSLTTSYATGDVNGAGGSSIGGLIGYCQSCNEVNMVYSTGQVTGDSNTGGLIGRNTGSVANSFSVSEVLGAGANIGPVIGSGTGSNIYNATNVTCDADTGTAGIQPCNTTYTGSQADISDYYGFANPPVATWDRVGSTANGTDDHWTISGSALPALWHESTDSEVAIWTGAGTADSPYEIGTKAEWNAIGSNHRWMSSHFKLTANLDFDSSTLIRIGNQATFNGTIDGNGFEIQNFTTTATKYNSGLIHALGADGVLKNIKIVGSVFNGTSKCGILVGRNYGTITDSHIAGDINGSSGLGGVAGYTYGGQITRVVFDGTITGGGQSVNGGITGAATENSLIDQCKVAGTISGGNDYNGAIVGSNSGTISNCYSVAAFTGADDWTGGLVGKNGATGVIKNSYSAGSATAAGDGSFGGIVGWNVGNMENNFVVGTLLANDGSTAETGFILSLNEGTATGNYFLSTLSCDADSSTAGVQACNSDESSGSYANMSDFYIKTNAPLSNWDFTNIWKENGAALPTLLFEP